MGRCVVVRLTDPGELTVLLTSRRTPPFSGRQLGAAGLDPAGFRVIVAKGVNAPLAAYGPLCPTIIRVDTPGVTCADPRKLEYRYRRRPMFPFDAPPGSAAPEPAPGWRTA